jgi:hypothetical protein
MRYLPYLILIGAIVSVGLSYALMVMGGVN